MTETFKYKINLIYLINKIGEVKMGTIIEMGKISSRGQVAIPADIREQLGLDEGTKVLFFTEQDTLMMKKVTEQSFAQITKPLKLAARQAGMKEKDVPAIIQRFRNKRR